MPQQQPPKTNPPAAPAPNRRLISVSREQFDSVPRKRAAYIFAYAVIVLVMFGARALLWNGVALPDALVTGSDIVVILGYFVFYYNFIGALRVMGYEAWIILALSLFAAIPVPGALLVAYMDRRIATAWDTANPDKGGYRQKPPQNAD